MANSAHEGSWALCLESGTVLLVHQRHLPNDRKLELRIVHFQHVIAPAFRSWKHGRVDDLDGARLRTMSPSHLRIQLTDRTVDVDVTELLVHIVCVCAALVP